MDYLNAAFENHLEEQKRTVASLADLDTFLRARLDEDERIARAGEDACWHVDHCDDEGPEFMARFDPARALRDVAAKRRLLDDVLPIIDELDEIAYSEGQGSVPYLEPRARFLKVLALPYADHEDYRQEWRPS